MAPPRPPKKSGRERSSDEDETTTAEIVAEDIEAGYDIQANAASRSLADDPASSSADEDRGDE